MLPAETLLRDFGIEKAIIWNEGKKKEKMEPSESMLKLAENIEKTLGVVCENKDDWDYVHKYISENKEAFSKTFKLNQSEDLERTTGQGGVHLSGMRQ